MTPIATQTVRLDDDAEVFYRSAGPVDAPVLLALHGFPTSSFQYRYLIEGLKSDFRVIAPDLPGFGFTRVPSSYKYTFDSLSKTVEKFVDKLGLKSFFVYLFDYGAPTAFRLALRRPELIKGIISQNGNAFDEGLGDFWQPIQSLWAEFTEEKYEKLKDLLTFEMTKFQYEHGESPETIKRLAPETYHLDFALLSRPGNAAIQQALFKDYGTNVDIYPQFQKYLADKQPPLLAVWGKNDVIFVPPGAEAFPRILPKAKVVLLDAGHFALESHTVEIVGLVKDFLNEHK